MKSSGFRNVSPSPSALAGTAAVGLENPFFRVKQCVGPATVQVAGCDLISYTSFDYLGLARDPRVAAAAQAAIDSFGTSASASRLVGGNNPILEQLDETLATFLGVEAAVSLPSGYGVNASVLGHLFGSDDFILYDELRTTASSRERCCRRPRGVVSTQ